MRHYIAIIHKEAGSDFGISFPDFPGCVSAGSTLQEALEMGAEALAGHIEIMEEDGEAIPEPSSMDEIMADRDNRDGVAVLVQAPVRQAKAVRVNITLPEDVLNAIDKHAEAHGYSRSGFIAKATKEAMGRAA